MSSAKWRPFFLSLNVLTESLKVLSINVGILSLSYEVCLHLNQIALRWMPKDLTEDKSTLVQVMAWCR